LKLRDALSEIEKRLDGARVRLQEARASDAREKAASEREEAARRVESASAKLEKTIEAFAVAFDELAAVIPSGQSLLRYESNVGGRPMSPIESARLIATEGLYSRAPELFEVVGRELIGWIFQIYSPVAWRRNDGLLDTNIPKQDDITFLPASGAAERNVAEPLRFAARAIRAGKMAPNEAFNPAALRKPVVEPKPFGFRRVYLLKRVAFVDPTGARIVAESGESTNLYEPVAAAALQKGAAVEPLSEEAEEHRAALRRNGYDVRRIGNEIVDVGINLKTMQDNERARLNQNYDEAAE
jgi:hypothetical protein